MIEGLTYNKPLYTIGEPCNYEPGKYYSGSDSDHELPQKRQRRDKDPQNENEGGNLELGFADDAKADIDTYSFDTRAINA